MWLCIKRTGVTTRCDLDITKTRKSHWLGLTLTDNSTIYRKPSNKGLPCTGKVREDELYFVGPPGLRPNHVLKGKCKTEESGQDYSGPKTETRKEEEEKEETILWKRLGICVVDNRRFAIHPVRAQINGQNIFTTFSNVSRGN